MYFQRERERDRETERQRERYLPASGIANSATTHLMADLFISSCFSNSCLTEFALTLDCT